MIVGIGVDIAEIARLEQAIRRHGSAFLHRVFTPGEIRYCEAHREKYARYAARFAAKEAAMKALGTGWRSGVRWVDLEVVNQPGGRPTLELHGRCRDLAQALGVRYVHLTLSHDRELAVAQVVLEC
jgi:holo-[acyl-carrier protein] synthase